MIESPLIQELLEQRSKQVQNQNILRILTLRFGALPEGLAAGVKAIQDDSTLAELMDFAVVSPDLEAFRQRLTSES